MKLAKPLIVTALLTLGLTAVVSNPVLSDLSGNKISEVKADANSDSAVATAALNEMNRLRTQNGQYPVSWDADLQNIANKRVNDQVAINDVDYHRGFDRSVYPSQYVTSSSSEIVGLKRPHMSFDNLDTTQKGQRIITDYYRDYGNADFGHMKSMLSPFIDHAAFAVATGSDGTTFNVGVFAGTPETFQGAGGNGALGAWNVLYTSNGKTGFERVRYDLVDENGTRTDYRGYVGNDPQYGYTFTQLSDRGNMEIVNISGDYSPLYTFNGTRVSNRGLAPGSSWATDRLIIIGDHTYYRVSTNEFVKDENLAR
ncbi:CAP domain-containing protein [Companilactobacillus mishanensis]|uniref:CAP domain-containing protein n=1 Tax=Companilactobacillus mishanensis TaxID=2486008 RepID=UPI000F7B4AD2|nr:CAP domain-containing protein [Companilactobacillus mishanensis]